MHDAYTIGVPVFVILLGILLNQRGMDKMNSDLSGRMDKLDGRMDKLDGRIDKLDGRIDKLDSDLTGRIDRIQADLSRFYQILGEHSGKIDMLSKKA